MIQKPTNTIGVVIITILCIICIPKTFAAEATQLNYNVNLTESNCTLPIGLVAIPSGQTSNINNIYSEKTLLRGIIVNRCNKKIDNLRLVLTNSSNHIEQNMDWLFTNITEGNNSEFTMTVENKQDMNFSVYMLNLKIDNNTYYSEKLGNFNWQVVHPLYRFEGWNREIDFNTFTPKITDNIIFTTNFQADKISLRYPNFYGNSQELNFIYVSKCQIDGNSCRVIPEYNPSYTTLDIRFEKQILNNSNIELSYNIEKSLNYTKKNWFPFDQVSSKNIFFPDKINIGNSTSSLDILYTNINFKIITPSGFIFNEKKSKELTGNINSSCNALQYTMPSKNLDNEIEFYLDLYLTEVIRSPQFELLSNNGVILYSGRLDSCQDLNKFALVFDRGEIYKVIFWIIVIISLFFIIRSFWDNTYKTLENYITVIILTIIGQFLIFPRPYNITINEIIIFVSGIIIILSFLIRKFNLIKLTCNILSKWWHYYIYLKKMRSFEKRLNKSPFKKR